MKYTTAACGRAVAGPVRTGSTGHGVYFVGSAMLSADSATHWPKHTARADLDS